MAAVKHGNNRPASGQLTQAARLVAAVGQFEIRYRRAQLRHRMIRMATSEMIPSVRCTAIQRQTPVNTDGFDRALQQGSLLISG